MKRDISYASHYLLSVITLNRPTLFFLAILPLVVIVSYKLGLADGGGNDHSGGTVPTPNLISGQWEGSPQGIAYSEFNHVLMGVGVILVGLAEFRTAMNWTALVWLHWMLPVSLLGSGIFLIIWSDHVAWPIGSWTFEETFSGNDWEVLQHKIFGILALAVGIVEWLQRYDKLEQRVWQALLPSFALVGSLMLFSHIHGHHPANSHIQLHHTLMGSFALIGGLAWFVGEGLHRTVPTISTLSSRECRSIFKILWAVAVMIIGIMLLFYSES